MSTKTISAVAVSAMMTMLGCAAEATDEGEATLASEIQQDQLFATAKLNVDGYGIVGQPAGDPACADQFIGTTDEYCPLPFETGPTRLGWATHVYALVNRTTSANSAGFESLAGKITALAATPAIDGLASEGEQKVDVRAHRIVGAALDPSVVGDAPRTCADWNKYFVKGAQSGKWLPQVERFAAKLGGLAYENGTDIGDDGVLTTEACGISVMLLQQATTLTWDRASRAYTGSMATPLGPDGETVKTFSHGTYQVDFLPRQSVSMPSKPTAKDAPAAFTLKLSHRVGQ